MCKHSCTCFLSLLCSERVRRKTEIQRTGNVCTGRNPCLDPIYLEQCIGYSLKNPWKVKVMWAFGEAGSSRWMDGCSRFGCSRKEFCVLESSQGNWTPHSVYLSICWGLHEPQQCWAQRAGDLTPKSFIYLWRSSPTWPLSAGPFYWLVQPTQESWLWQTNNLRGKTD